MIVSWKKFIAAVMLVLILSAVEARADRMRPTIEYSTTGAIDAPITGKPVVTFQGISDGTFTPGTPFNLGTFTLSPSLSGLTDYAGTFAIQLRAKSIDGVPLPSDSPSATLHGHFNGDIGPVSRNPLLISFGDGAPVQGFPFGAPPVTLVAGSFAETIAIDGPQLLGFNMPTSRTSITVSGLATPNPAPVPEPTAIALFLIVSCLIVNKRHVISKRCYSISQ